MKITVVGASGLIGTRLVEILTEAGHTVVAASRSTGVDAVSGEGLADALSGAQVVVDVTNSPSFEDGPVLDFFSTVATNLTAAARAAGVGHYVLLSIVGVDGIPDSGYMRAKVAQERLIAKSGVPYTFLRATQFHEFADTIIATMTADGRIRVPEALIQPISADEVTAKLASVTVGEPVNGVIDIGGPDKITFAELARRVLAARGEDLPVGTDPAATYFGARLSETSLVTGPDGVIATLPFTG